MTADIGDRVRMTPMWSHPERTVEGVVTGYHWARCGRSEAAVSRYLRVMGDDGQERAVREGQCEVLP